MTSRLTQEGLSEGKIVQVKRKLHSFRKYRKIIGWSFLFLIFLGSFGTYSFGTPCSLNLFGVPLTCPLGFVQMALASRSLMVELWPSVGLVVLLIILLGRFFCAWVCPSMLFGGANGYENTLNGLVVSDVTLQEQRIVESQETKSSWINKYSNYAVLAGSLVSAYVFGFPVFCLFCPVGLTTGIIFSISRAFLIKQPGIELILLPIFLVLEIKLLKKGCRSLCPMGALLGILASFNKRFFRPRVNPEKCFHAKGIDCQVCTKVCTEKVNLKEKKSKTLSKCTNCLDCYGMCPSGAIEYPVRELPKRIGAWLKHGSVSDHTPTSLD